MTLEEIEAQIRSDNPSTTDAEGNRVYPGDPTYEALIQEWTDNMVASIEAVPQKTWPNASAFLAEFSIEEKAAISLSTHPVIAALRLDLLSWPGEVWSNDERIRMGMDALVEANILPEFRRQEILAT